MNKNLKIEQIDYNREQLNKVVKEWDLSKYSKYLLRYPTVYILNDKNEKNNYEVYVGETNNIKFRTRQHLIKRESEWLDLSNSDTSSMYVIGHKYFNKSLTMDIENRLMQYLSSVDSVVKIHNNRTNQQNDYYTSDKLEEVFSDVWNELHKKNKELFPIENIVRDSAIFKASPFHKLTDEQIIAKEEILSKIDDALKKQEEGQLIIVEGEAGSGKTVLMSTLFYELKKYGFKFRDKEIKIHFLINHDEHVKIYQQIAKKLGLTEKNNEIINKPTSFILKHEKKDRDKVDVVLVDEAHLLLTQGKMSYQGEGHLKDLLERAKVVVTVFDKKQILSREQIWEYDSLDNLMSEVCQKNNLIQLKEQMRINGSIETINWIRGFIDYQLIEPIPKDKKGYEIKIFDKPLTLENEIRKKANNTKAGISRIVATFDWEYNKSKTPEKGKYWTVKIGDWSMPWNKQIKNIKGEGHLPWVEKSNTINEIGSTFTIQGIDLNYAGVIIGPSVKYRSGKVIFDKSSSKNSKIIQNRTLSDKTKQNYAEQLLQNELNVLLTRGINGLYIYAVDDELRKALKEAEKGCKL